MPEPLRLLFDGPEDARQVVVLAHGAGGPMDSPFLNDFVAGLAREGIRVARFEFPYMRERRRGGRGGRSSAPDREPVLRGAWKEAVEALGGGSKVVIGGKSLGGRIASLVADELGARGLVCLGYPFHPPGQPSKLRTKHLGDLRTPALVLQGTRDPFGTPEDVSSYTLAPTMSVVWVEDGDHSWKPRAKSGATLAGNIAFGIEKTAGFVRERFAGG